MRFPEAVMRRAEALARGECLEDIPPALPAATVVILRPADPFEVLLMRRPTSMAFAGGMHVFPGGRVEDGDGSHPGSGGSALVGAALRETLEECGITLEGSGLRRMAHWVTPEAETRRFDTHFFLCAVDGRTEIVPEDVSEADAAFWITPSEGLERHRRGELPMLPPTLAVLWDLASCGSLDEALDKPRTIVPLMPRPVVGPAGSSGISWVLVDAGTGAVIADAAADEQGGMR